ncbi:sugar ABC transporter substrate-binding protein [Lichenihabitans psoromatis]|uniref:sugar ABC transporter substrate-binding protein n=1 Tax=Lichenihabitans psoromatis TaxID=2528642 RepID=UPI00103855FC|nr:sugar ABC transporter substrate-binding protein [Lichenihabitans psoromatis]
MKKVHRTALGILLAAGLLGGSAHAADVTLGFSSVGLSFPFAAAIAKGFQDEAVKRGAKAVVLDAKADVQKQANDIDDLIGQKVNGLVIMPLDSVVAQGWVDRATAAGLPVVAVGSQIGDPKKRAIRDVYPKLTALTTQDEVAAGNAAGQVALDLMPKDHLAKIAIIEGAAGFAEVAQRTDGFKQALDKAGAKYEIVASQPGDWTAEKGEAACQNILAAHPDVDIFYNQADDMVVGCARAVRSAGSQAKLIGVGGSKLAVAAIKAGQVDGTVCYKPEALGALAFDTLYDNVTGKTHHKAEFLSYPTPGVTKANIDACVGQW